MSQKIAYGKIHWSPKYNIRKDYGVYENELVLTKEARSLAAKIAVEGFSESLPVHVTSGISDVQIADALEERQKILDRLRTLIGDNGSMDPGLRAETQAVFTFLLSEWRDAEGKLVEPEFIGLTGNRRSLIFRHAAAYRMLGVHDAKNGIEVPEGPFDSGIHCIVESFPYDEDHMVQIERIQVDENEAVAFQKPFSSLERLSIARKMKLRGENQNALRNKFGATRGVGLWKFLELDALFPSLGLWDAVHAEPKVTVTGADGKPKEEKNPKWVNIDRVLNRYTTMQNMMERRNKNDVDAYNATVKGQKNPRELLSRDEVRAFMFGEETDKAVRSKVMDKGKIESSLQGSPIHIVKVIAEVILTNSLVLLEKLVEPRQFLLNSVMVANEEQMSALTEAVKSIFTPEAATLATERFEDAVRMIETTAETLSTTPLLGVEEPKVEEPKVEEPKVEETITESEQPKAEEPVLAAVASETPAPETPAPESPAPKSSKNRKGS